MNIKIVNSIRNDILVKIQDLKPADQKEIINLLLEDFKELAKYL